jgi:hypothetical protein
MSGSLPQLDRDPAAGVEEEGKHTMGQRGSTVGMVRAADGGDSNQGSGEAGPGKKVEEVAAHRRSSAMWRKRGMPWATAPGRSEWGKHSSNAGGLSAAASLKQLADRPTPLMPTDAVLMASTRVRFVPMTVEARIGEVHVQPLTLCLEKGDSGTF